MERFLHRSPVVHKQKKTRILQQVCKQAVNKLCSQCLFQIVNNFFLFKHYFALIHLPQELKAHRGGSCNKFEMFEQLSNRADNAIKFGHQTRVKTHKLQQTCTQGQQVVTSLCSKAVNKLRSHCLFQVVGQVWNKLLTTCSKLDGTF